ncbi:ArpU family phage packaging/lysis transcriptional regulator [Paenibacillus amylolyticus]|uniref:ArpU family phage packaging/lysis transcriptional regulator n=1 Tax=Paenibacillus amylolyticus TaxID=1451 RepID=UPI0032424FFD
MGQQSFLPEIDRKLTQAAVEAALEKYRIYKHITFEEREASTTASYAERFHGPTNQTSDQTANIAIHNVDTPAMMIAYCNRIERVVRRLPKKERFLMEERYLTDEHDYITDQRVYQIEFDPPITWPTYKKIRWKAFYKLALDLNIIVENPEREEDICEKSKRGL